MFEPFRNVFQSLRAPGIKEVFFPSLSLNRKMVLWYADQVVRENSVVETVERLGGIDELRKQRSSLTFICNHLSYADSHVIEVLMVRSGLRDLADHLIHIAGHKTYQIYRRFLTRSLNTVRVYQPKAQLDKRIKRKMNSRALKWAAYLKRRGYSLLVFPEGTRTRRDRRFNLHGANPKATIYFRESHVVPLALMGSERIMPVGKILPRPALAHVRIGNPIDHAALEADFHRQHPEWSETEMRQALMLHYMQQINQLLDSEYRFGDQ